MSDNPTYTPVSNEELEVLKANIAQLFPSGEIDTGQLYRAFYPRQKVRMLEGLDTLVEQKYLKVVRGRKAPVYTVRNQGQ